MVEAKKPTKREQRYLDQLSEAKGDHSKLWTKNGGLWTQREAQQTHQSLKAKGLLNG